MRYRLVRTFSLLAVLLLRRTELVGRHLVLGAALVVGRGRRGVGHHSTLAKLGSRRLNTTVAIAALTMRYPALCSNVAEAAGQMPPPALVERAANRFRFRLAGQPRHLRGEAFHFSVLEVQRHDYTMVYHTWCKGVNGPTG